MMRLWIVSTGILLSIMSICCNNARLVFPVFLKLTPMKRPCQGTFFLSLTGNGVFSRMLQTPIRALSLRNAHDTVR
jgi:hypothetical protein